MPRVRTIKPYRLHSVTLQPGRITKVTEEKARQLVRTGCFVYHDPTAPDPEEVELKKYGYFEEE